MKEQLEREHERKMTEMREAARRMKDDCSHQMEMQRCDNKPCYLFVFVLFCFVFTEDGVSFRNGNLWT